MTLNANYTERDVALSEPRAFFDPITANWNLNFEVRQAVYSGGKLSTALDGQKYLEEAAVLDLQSVINQALLETRTRFYDVLLARDQIEVEAQNVWQRAVLGVATVSSSSAYAHGQLERVVQWIETNRPDVELLEYRTEFL